MYNINFSFLDSKNTLHFIKNKRMLKILMQMMIYCVCFGCVTWQAVVCFQKYLSMPTGAKLDLVDTQDVSLSFSFCSVVYNYNQNSNGRLFKQKIEQLQEIKIRTEKDTIYLKQQNESKTYDFIVSMPEFYLCKEFPLPKTLITDIIITHNAADRNNNFHLFIHPTHMINAQEFVIQYPNKIFHKNFDGITILKIESYDLSASPEIACADTNYHSCKMEKILLEYNRTLGCAYPIQR